MDQTTAIVLFGVVCIGFLLILVGSGNLKFEILLGQPSSQAGIVAVPTMADSPLGRMPVPHVDGIGSPVATQIDDVLGNRRTTILLGPHSCLNHQKESSQKTPSEEHGVSTQRLLIQMSMCLHNGGNK